MIGKKVDFKTFFYFSLGSGKSTLFNALFRIIETESSGAIMIGGEDSRNWKLEQIRNFISLISQGTSFFT
jgi:ABC-type multidrug transport system fused ATPase/permease subunit